MHAAHRAASLSIRTRFNQFLSTLFVHIQRASNLLHQTVDTPVAGIYGATSPDSHPPLTDRMAVCSARKLCSPCRQRSCPYGHHACMEDLKLETVHEAFGQVLSR